MTGDSDIHDPDLRQQSSSNDHGMPTMPTMLRTVPDGAGCLIL